MLLPFCISYLTKQRLYAVRRMTYKCPLEKLQATDADTYNTGDCIASENGCPRNNRGEGTKYERTNRAIGVNRLFIICR